MQKEQGNIQVNTENIFPIIKKFLYADHEIFLRELVSNAIDACQKLKRLASLAEYTEELGELKVEVFLDKDARKIIVRDNGIGMTAEEVKKYINQVAFSGAAEFVQRYQEAGSDIIGKFGLGFYSAFMVADKVELISKSYKKEADAVHWQCAGDPHFELNIANKTDRGTEVILHIGKDGEEFLNAFRIREILEKYARFLPIPVWFEGKQINDTRPIWTRPVQELSEQDYLQFYRQLYPMAVEEPVFWIHLSVDYPFSLTGVLYFPKVTQAIDWQKKRIQLYCRQVFITDEVSNIVPEFLTLLHGVIDSPDIPLNVSRSYLQSDSNVRKINQYISRKVAEKLQELFEKDRSAFEAKWQALSVFVKYGMITDDKFFEKAKQFCLLKNTEGKFFTIDEYKEKIAPRQTNKHDKVVALYAQDSQQQYAYILAAQQMGYDVLLMNDILDMHFIQHLESQLKQWQFRRVDADVADQLIDKKETASTASLNPEQQHMLVQLLRAVLNDEKANIQALPLSKQDLPLVLIIPEHMRRMKDMLQHEGKDRYNLHIDGQYIINTEHTYMRHILEEKDEDRKKELMQHAYDLAQLAQNQLTGKALHDFIQRSLQLIA